MNQLDLFSNRDRTSACTVQVDVRPATADDNKTVYGDDLIQWVWDCPVCGGRTIATKSERATPEAIKADARCHYCRKRNRQEPNAGVTLCRDERQ